MTEVLKNLKGLPNLRRIARHPTREDGLPYSLPAAELRKITQCDADGLVERLMRHPNVSGCVSYGRPRRFYAWIQARQGWAALRGDLWWAPELVDHLRIEAHSYREDAELALAEHAAPSVETVMRWYRGLDYASTIDAAAHQLSRNAAAIVRLLHRRLSVGVDRVPAPVLTSDEWTDESCIKRTN